MEAPVSDLLIRDIPDPLKQEIAQAAKTRGQSLSRKAIELLRKGLIAEQETKPELEGSAWDVLRAIFEKGGPLDGSFAKVMEEIEAERKRDFGRPVDFGRDDLSRE
jgi:plasmid stability protein